MKLVLYAVLLAAFAQGHAQSGAPIPPPPKAPGEVLVALPGGADPEKAMQAAYSAFAGRKWAVTRDAEGAIVARNRNFDIDATLKVFVGDGALRYIDGTVDNKGRKAQVPERWLNYIRADLRRPARAPARDHDAAERLQQLRSLLDRGLITPDEYEQKRAEILRGL